MTMLNLGPLALLHPWLLLGLALLPLLWWLIRLLPPQPRKVAFPPIALLASLPPSAAPLRASRWLLALRLLIAGLLIIAFAEPYWQPVARDSGDGPVLLLVDNGWTAAPGWEGRMALADRLLGRLAREGRPVMVVPTAPPPGGWAVDAATTLFRPMPAEDARRALRVLAPRAWPDDLAQITRWLEDWGHDGTSLWIGDGYAKPGALALARVIARRGAATYAGGDGSRHPFSIRGVTLDGADFVIEVANTGGASARLRAENDAGRVMARGEVVFKPGARNAKARLEVPPDLRDAVSRLVIEGESHAGAVHLFDDRAARPLVGIEQPNDPDSRTPLRSAGYFLERALAPYALLRQGPLQRLLDDQVQALIIADHGRFDPDTEARLRAWVEAGGLLLRFAGPKLAADPADDPLLPARLRQGERAFGGALSWEQPQKLGSFSDDGPLAGLAIPDDVSVARQVLAEPDGQLPNNNWAALADGTPLITGRKAGAGWLVLVHSTANPDWSNLALSGSYVEILRRILALARHGGAAERPSSGLLSLKTQLSGFGVLQPPDPAIGPQKAEALGQASARTPPGLYGDDHRVIAVNFDPGAGFRPLEALPGGFHRVSSSELRERSLSPVLLLLAALLLIVDLSFSLRQRGLLAAIALFAFIAPAADAGETPANLAGAMRLACIATDRALIDRACLDGLRGLGVILRTRSAVAVGEPVLARPQTDELGFFPLLYWPVLDDAPPLDDREVEKVRAYLANSGLILFDTGMTRGDAEGLAIDRAPIRSALQRITRGLDLPPLGVLSPDHVLAHSFYILDQFPGRLSGGQVWVDANREGVSGVVIGGHDWARAWAIDATIPGMTGAAGGARQERAWRFGVNLVVYALTGTYKADQVHLPALLERMQR